MTDSPTTPPTPSARRLWRASLLALAVALVLLVTVVLPAEHGVDPTSVGRLLGLDALHQPVRQVEIRDVVGGNEALREVEIPDFGEPVPLPNPAVFQEREEAPRQRRLEITVPAESQTEIKARLTEGQVLLFSWAVDRGTVYADFHGHDPSLGDDFWVRYREHQEGSGNQGSLVAPFSGEHGWFWLNYNEFPVVITLELEGYFDEVIDYGLF